MLASYLPRGSQAMLFIPSLKGLWTRAMLRGVHYRDSFQRIDMLYMIPDPWNLDNPQERFRYQETNRLIRNEFGHVTRLLEVGCGEGYQSQYLAQVCSQLHGCDVSTRAVERARKRCPNSTFSVGTLGDILVHQAELYDLVVACEVLYYIDDVLDAIQTMSRLGTSCLVTYYQSHQDRLDRIITPLELGDRAIIRNGDSTWIAVWWRSDRLRRVQQDRTDSQSQSS